MRILLTTIVVVFMTSTSFASQWCEWSGSEGINCQSDSKGYILINSIKTRTPALANSKGWFKVTETPVTPGADQVIDAEVWSFASPDIGKTWSVRDMTTQEIQDRDDQIAVQDVLTRNEYYILKMLMLPGIINLTTGAIDVSVVPQYMIDAYQARGRLEAE